MKIARSLTMGVLLFSMAAQGQAQELDWAYSIRHSSVQNAATNIASNGKHFAIVASVTSLSYDLKEGSPNFTGRPNVVAKYDADANIQWVIEHPGGGGGTRILHMDAAGNVYACGRFSGTLDFDPSSQTNNVTSSAGAVYVQKLDPNGSLLWVGYTTVDGEPVKMALKSNGNIVVAGRSQGSSQANLSSGSSVTVEKGVFMLEFAPNGDALNAYSIATPTSFNNSIGLAIDWNDNVYIGASIGGEMDLDLTSGTRLDTSHSGYDAVLVKYDSDFNYKWHKVFGDVPTSAPDGVDILTSLVFGSDGYLYAAGWFTWTTDFDPDDNPGTWTRTAATGSQSPDGFVIRYNTDGNIQWIQEAGGHTTIKTNADVNFIDMVEKNGRLVVFGQLNGSADFDGGAGDMILSTQDNGLGMCMAQYTLSGVFDGAWLIDGYLANEYANGIEVLGTGVVVYGTFQKKLDADITTDTYLLYTDSTGRFYSADNDVFVAKYTLSEVSGMEDGPGSKNNLVVYPNPASERISVSGIPIGSDLEILDLTGKVVLRLNDTKDQNLVWDIKDLDEGLYLIQVNHRGYTTTGKVLVSR